MAEAISPRKGPDQHRNIIWDIKKSGAQIRSRDASTRISNPYRSTAMPGRSASFPRTGYARLMAQYEVYEAGSDDAAEDVSVMTRGAVVTHGTQVYFSVSSYGYLCSDDEGELDVPHYVFSYDSSGDVWSTLPACEVHDFGLAVVNELVTIVGGEYDKLVDTPRRSASFPRWRRGENTGPVMSADLLVLKKGEWEEEHFPPMTICRRDPSVICAQQYLIVAGGVSIVKRQVSKFTFERVSAAINSVEMMNTETKVWSRVASLPEAASSLAAAHCGDQLYFLGGRNEDGSTSSVFTCSVQSLIKSSFVTLSDSDSEEDWEEDSGESLVKSSDIDSGEKLKQQVSMSPVWRKAADVPVFRSTCVTIYDKLLAIGGRTSTYRSSANIYCYSPLGDSWHVTGKMPTARSLCIAASVMNKLVVVGGLTEGDESTDVMEIGTIISDPTLTKKNLWTQLRSLDDWYTLGLQLDIPDGKLKEIEDAHPGKPARCRETVDYWLKRGENPSWETLTEAVVAMKCLDIATQIQETYLQKPANDSSENSETPKSKMEDPTEVLAGHLQEKLKTSDSPQLGGKPDLADAFRITFPVAKKWKSIGIFLKVPPHQLDMIDIPQKDFDDCLRDMLSVWLTQIDPLPTWQSLADAVRIFDPSVARQISH